MNYSIGDKFTDQENRQLDDRRFDTVVAQDTSREDPSASDAGWPARQLDSRHPCSHERRSRCQFRLPLPGLRQTAALPLMCLHRERFARSTPSSKRSNYFVTVNRPGFLRGVWMLVMPSALKASSKARGELGVSVSDEEATPS